MQTPHARRFGRDALPGDAQLGAVDADAQIAAVDARELHADDDLVLGLDDVDVGLPAVSAQTDGEVAEELAEGIAALGVAQLPFSSLYSASTTSPSPLPPLGGALAPPCEAPSPPPAADCAL